MNQSKTALPWLGWLGAGVLFFSWLAQNYFEGNRQDELDYLNQAQLLISVEEGHLSEWLAVLLIEQAKDSPNDDIVRPAAMKAAQHQLNILTWAVARVTDPETHETILNDKAHLQKAIITAYEQPSADGLIAILNALGRKAERQGPSMIGAFSARYDEARRSAAKWRQVFLFTYGIGSLIIAFSVFRAWHRHRSSAIPDAPHNKPTQRKAKGRR